MSDHVEITVDRDGWTKGLQLGMAQLDENGAGSGYRIRGPKYNGSSKTLLRHTLTARDAEEIRQMLDAVFPLDQEGRVEALREAVQAILTDAGLRAAEGEDRLAAYGRELADLIDPDKTAAAEVAGRAANEEGKA